MIDLQIRRIDCNIDKAKSIENQLEGMSEQIEMLLNDIFDLERNLFAIRLGMIRNANPPQEGPTDAADSD